MVELCSSYSDSCNNDYYNDYYYRDSSRNGSLIRDLHAKPKRDPLGDCIKQIANNSIQNSISELEN